MILLFKIAMVMLIEQTVANPTVTISQGKLSGTWMRTRGGRRIASFRGVPYAAPPVGDLRFESPQPPKSWPGVRFAEVDGHRCLQQNPFLGIYGEEDCLYLNVYSPNVSADSMLPVLFFIHGGAFKGGSGGSFLYGPDYLLDEDVVLVTINYRLGVFGFLSLGDETLPGNFGLKDQRAALRWVRDNIAQFGGNPSAVTLFGESAGAASVHYHMMFNTDEGLFRAGICHSGSAFTSGLFQRPGDQKPLVEYILKENGCSSDNSSIIVDCLKGIRPFRLARTVASFSPPFNSLMKRVELAPVMEPDCVEDVFISGSPWNKTTSLPMVMGNNQYEALFLLTSLLKDQTDKKFEEFNNDYEKILPHNMMFETSAKDPIEVARKLREFYFKDNAIDREHMLNLVNLITDGVFNYGLVEAVNHNVNDTYLYSFNYLGSKSFLNILGYENNYGPSHVDELFLFFPMSLGQAHRRNGNEQTDKILSKQLIKMWTNFATNMVPTVEESLIEWPPASDDLEFLSIDGPGPHNLSVGADFFRDKIDFWSSLPIMDQPLPDSIPCS